MNYAAFKKLVQVKGWTIRFLRSDDASPTEELLDVMDAVGLTRYESFVLRLQQEVGK